MDLIDGFKLFTMASIKMVTKKVFWISFWGSLQSNNLNLMVADHMIKSVQLKLEGGKSQVKDSRIILKSRIMVIITVVKNLEDGTSCMRKPIYKQYEVAQFLVVEDNLMKIDQRLEYRQAFQIIHKSLIMVSIKKGKGWQNGIYQMMKQVQQILVCGLRSAIVLMNILKLLIMVNIKIAERLADGIFCTESNIVRKKIPVVVDYIIRKIHLRQVCGLN
ncbi:unnamed protein product [Paramecium primaurelia]|uniref:Uncharacterized protein n=1 Tax=Paramecium primaurelia TaxID=5886 RepID=A0A8S1QUJ6_PARPR|nr:unnamed protein product [Paramecium primaurelia]